MAKDIRPLNEVELEIVRADIAFLKQKEIDSGDWDKWKQSQRVFNGTMRVLNMNIPFTITITCNEITEEMFRNAVGRAPVYDELDRCNCSSAGSFGHISCGWCMTCSKPCFICGHHIGG